MKPIDLSGREKGLANYLIDSNKEALNGISKDCVSPIIAIRQICKKTAEAIGSTELKSQSPLSEEEWRKITMWISDVFFERA